MVEPESIVDALAALAQPHRLAAFRALVQAGPAGLPAGAVSAAVGLTPSALSFHLSHLLRAGLVTRRRDGRQLLYAADFGAVNGLVAYLTENCCGGIACDTVPIAQRDAA